MNKVAHKSSAERGTSVVDSGNYDALDAALSRSSLSEVLRPGNGAASRRNNEKIPFEAESHAKTAFSEVFPNCITSTAEKRQSEARAFGSRLLE